MRGVCVKESERKQKLTGTLINAEAWLKTMERNTSNHCEKTWGGNHNRLRNACRHTFDGVDKTN
jgi:hypothetical protein